MKLSYNSIVFPHTPAQPHVRVSPAAFGRLNNHLLAQKIPYNVLS